MKTKAHNNKAGGTVTAEVNDFWWQFFGYYQEKQILISMTKYKAVSLKKLLFSSLWWEFLGQWKYGQKISAPLYFTAE